MFFNNTDTQRLMLEQQLRLMREGVAPENIAKTHANDDNDALSRFAEGLGRFAEGFAEGWREAKPASHTPQNIFTHDDDDDDDIPKSWETWHPSWSTFWG